MEKNKKIKVMLALACQETIKAKTAFSIVHSIKDVPFEVDMVLRLGVDIVGSRVWLAKNAIKHGATHVLFIDHDMYFPPGTIEKMVAADKDIIGTPYNFRQFPLRSTAIPEGAEPTNNEYIIDPKDLPTEPFKALALGTGLLLIKTEVFSKLAEPWFQFSRNVEGELVQGEDTYFCFQARKAGYEVWCDPNLGARHLGEYPY